MFARECVNPSGESRADFRNAITAVTVAKSMGSKKAEIKDFLPKFGYKVQKESQESISMKLKTLQNMVKVAGKR